MQITKGVIPSALKIVIYGPEGIGKSTFAAQFPEPVFIDTEGSTKHMDVARLPKPTSWSMIKEQISYVKNNPEICHTLIIDTIDWAEQLCVEHICATYQKKGIEDFGYGKGYIFAKEEWARFLHLLDDVIDVGVNVVLTAHAQIRKFEQPDELGSYDRWELKLGQKTGSQTSPLVKEWADMILFANYKTFSIAVDDQGKKHKAQGGKRIMHTAHHPCWDAKNRHGLADELPFEYAHIAHILQKTVTPAAVQPTSTVVENPVQAQAQQTPAAPVTTPAPTNQLTKKKTSPAVMRSLLDLMEINNVSYQDIQMAVAERGYFPVDSPIENYGDDFVNAKLIGAWGQVCAVIREIKTLPEGI